MFIDLAILIGIGVIAETFAMGFLFTKNPINPTFVCSILIILVACTRWGIKGLVAAPVMALTSWVCGKIFLSAKSEVTMEFYGWQTLVATMVGDLSVGFICIAYKKISYTKMYQSITSTLGVTSLVLLVVLLFQAVAISLCGKAQFINFVLFNNIIGCVVTITLMIILNSRGIIVNVKEKIIADRKRAQEEAEYERQYIKSLNNEEKE